MKYLAINTAGAVTEVAAVNGKTLFYERDEEQKKASERLFVMIESALTRAEITLKELDFIAVCVGPGSFTGIRIGVSAARAFCHAHNLGAAPFTSDSRLAYNVKVESGARIITASDAGNSLFYVSQFNSDFVGLSPPECVNADVLKVRIEATPAPFVTVLAKGLGVDIPNAVIEKDGFEALRAAAEGAFKRNGVMDFNAVEPLYVRIPQAEADMKT
jgi:tRNA threonylcarbamoyl adenosine modification protein YeaZ